MIAAPADTPPFPESIDPGVAPSLGEAETLEQRFADVRALIHRAAARAGRDGEDVLLVAVTKEVDPARVAQAVRAGQADFGENRAQELTRKVRALPAGTRWHFLGRLQRNKVADVVGTVELLHSVDREELAEAVARRARALGLLQRVLVQVNTARDPAKAGVLPEDAPRLVARISALEGIRCEGLMTVPAFGADPRPSFAALRTIGADLRLRFPAVTHLSMGMSGDYEVAIEEGATIVRLGQALFGPRPPTRVTLE